MASKIVEIAQAVTDLLAAHKAAIGAPLDLEPVVERTYDLEASLQELTRLRLTVFPSVLEISRESRASHLHGYSIDVGIRRRASMADTADIDLHLECVELVADTLRVHPIATATMGELRAVEIANDPIYSQEQLRQNQVFLSVMRVVYPAGRAA